MPNDNLKFKINNKGFSNLFTLTLVGVGLMMIIGGTGYGYWKYRFKIETKQKTTEEIVKNEESVDKDLIQFEPLEIPKEEIKKPEVATAPPKIEEASKPPTPSPKPSPTPPPTPTPSPKPETVSNQFDISSVIPVIVKLECYFPNYEEPRAMGSGVIISFKTKNSKGELVNDFKIMTAGHLLIDKDTGEFSDGCEVYFSDKKGTSITKRFFATPSYEYYDKYLFNFLFYKVRYKSGEIVENMDFAILDIIGGFNKNDPDDPEFSFGLNLETISPFVERCAAQGPEIKIGKEIYVLGYPAIGGRLITITKGIISGFAADGPKISAAIDQGSSGGVVIDTDGCYVGMPLYGTVGKLSSFGFTLSSGHISSLLKSINLGESIFSLSIFDLRKINNLLQFHSALKDYYQDNKYFPETLNGLGAKYFPSDTNYPANIHCYSYRSDRKAFHLGVTLEETPEEFDEYSPRFYSEDASGFNSAASSDWINGFEASKNKTCLPNEAREWYSSGEGKWCFDIMYDTSPKPSIKIQNSRSEYLANLYSIFSKMFNFSKKY